MGKKVDYRHPYLTQHIIAYIGNKRRLLPLIYEAITKCYPDIPEGLTFLDMFAGGGVVSKFAKYLGFKVYSNDWEPYTYIINKSFLEIDEVDLKNMYREYGGIAGLLDTLNSLPRPSVNDQYIAKHYSPSTCKIEGLDFRKERMFYTRSNGLIIDKIRNKIEDLYPAGENNKSPDKLREKYLLISLLLYEAATHTNTSGVFKAYHKGFGGHGRDALSRILAPIRLRMPVLITSKHNATVFREDANKLILMEDLRGTDFDMVYLDPPYNQHQYGSNYHMLNTIGLWDRLPVNNNLNEKGILMEKAAIRKDWVITKSDYCYADRARDTFYTLIDNIKSKYILLSYSTEGIIPFDELKGICSEKGKIDIVTNEYTKYRGGKQSIKRLNKNIEFVMIIDTSRRSTKYGLKQLDNILVKKRLALLFNKKYSLIRLKENFSIDLKNKTLELEDLHIKINTRDFLELMPAGDIEGLSDMKSLRLTEKLEKSLCKDKEEELEELFKKIGGEDCDKEYFLKLIPDTIRKFAHKKYKDKFFLWLERARKIRANQPELYLLIRDRIDDLEVLALKRFSN